MLKISVDWSGAPLMRKVHEACTAAETVVATQAMKDTSKYVPARTGVFDAATHIEGGNVIIYPGPTARYLYAGRVMVDENGRGPFPTVDGPRFHRGAVLHPTDRPLVYSKSMHPDATDHWFEVSKARNMKTWLETAEKAIANGLNK